MSPLSAGPAHASPPGSAGGRPPSVADRLRQTWSRFAPFLPLLVLAHAAVLTWWLVQDSDQDQAPVKPRAGLHEPDYLMRGFLVQQFTPNGRLQAELTGDELKHYPDTDTIEIRRARILGISEDGRHTTATSAQAVVQGRGESALLSGGARVERAPLPDQEGADPLVLEGEVLRVNMQTEQLHSDLPVRLTQGHAKVDAQRLHWDHQQQKLLLSGGVKGVYLPPPPAGQR